MSVQTPTPRILLFGLVGMGLFLGFIFLFSLELAQIRHTLNNMHLLLWMALAGFFIGAGLALWINTRVKDSYDRFRIGTASIILSMLLTPMIGHLINRTFTSSVEKVTAEFIDVEPYISEPMGVLEGEEVQIDGYYVFLVHEGALIRVEHPTNPYPNATKGQMVDLPLRTGLFGYQIVSF